MSVVAYGFGRDTDVQGAPVAWGFGIFRIQNPYVPIRFSLEVPAQDRVIVVEAEPCQ